MDKKTLFKLSYGLYVVSSTIENKHNGCICNTVMQLTDSPLQIGMAMNKKNYTHDMIVKSKKYTLSILDDTTPFEIFQKLGFVSGRDQDKFKDIDIQYDQQGIAYLTKYTNGYISVVVDEIMDLKTHSYFIGHVVEMKTLSEVPSLTYHDYHAKVKPQATKKVKGYRCVVCGYVYEGDILPEDFICPICKHSVDDFVKIEE